MKKNRNGVFQSRSSRFRFRGILKLQIELLESRLLFAADFGDSLKDFEIQSTQKGLWNDPIPVAESIVLQAKVDALLGTLTSTASASEFFYPMGWKDDVDGGAFGVNLVQSTGQINLDDFRNDARFAGIDGSGFSAVVIDTGIDLNHPFFGPDVSPADGISDRIVFSYDFSGTNDSDASDFNGHGSNVSSIVASSDNTYRGMAPGASIIHLKVFPDSGSGASFADIEEALQWTVAHVATYNIASVNLSLGGGNVSYLQGGPLSDEFAALATLSVIPVVASGNDFYPYGSVQGINQIAADPNAISVGAVFDANIGGVGYGNGAIANTTAVDRIAPFTQRHASLLDILAPGAAITGANQSGGIVTFHGTSQATPHVAGIAVLAQQFAMQQLGRRLTLEEFRGLLRSSGVMLNDGDDEDDNVTNTNLNFPRVDVLELGNQILALRTSSISGRVFADQNGDGVGIGDAGSSGWTVFLDDNNNGLIDSGVVNVSSTDVPLTILSIGSSAIRSTNTVAAIPGLITDLNITLNINHTWDEDMRAFLIAPSGRRVELFANVGGDSDDFANTTFDDEAFLSVTTGVGPFAGSFRPTGLLSDFDGLVPNGVWMLEIVDDYNGDGGPLSSWSLAISTTERTISTPGSGIFSFGGLAAGSYFLRQINQSGFTETAPISGLRTISLTSNQNLVQQDFGNYGGPATSLQLILPMYQYPLSAPNTLNTWWQQALNSATAATTLTIIANPSSGPIASNHPDYVNWITGLSLLQSNPFIRVLGYVKTRVSPGSAAIRSSSQILADVALYGSSYRNLTTNTSLIDGIFLDEMSNNVADISTYSTVANGIRANASLGGNFIASNPGTTVPVEYLDQNTADLFIVREGTPIEFINNALPSYVTSPTYSAIAFGAIIHSAIGNTTLADMLRKVKRGGLDYAFITDDSGANPFDQAPTYFSDLVRDIHAPYITASVFSLPENSPNGTILGIPVSGDPDQGQSLTYGIVAGNVGNAFSINVTTGQLSVNNSAILDFETIPSFGLTVRVSDNGSPPLSDSILISVNLSDVLESPTLTITSSNKIYDRNAYTATASMVGASIPIPTLLFSYFSDASGLNIIPAPIQVGMYFVKASSAANSSNLAAESAIAPFSITPKALSGSVVVDNKAFDNTTSGTILKRVLVGVNSGDAVTYIGGIANFASAAIGNGKTVNITGLSISGADAANYTVNSTAVTTANILAIKGSIFYNNSAFEFPLNTANGVTAAMDNVTGKTLLQSSATSALTTTFANVSNYSRGINGIVFDVGNVVSNLLSASDFVFRRPNSVVSGVVDPSSISIGPTGWSLSATPSVINVLTTGAKSRISLEWNDNDIQNTWLQIIVKANSTTGLTSPAVFYIGHALGDANGVAPYRVNNSDLAAVQPFVSAAIVSITEPRDLNKDKKVNNQDLNYVQTKISASILLNNVTIPIAGSAMEGSGPGFGSLFLAMEGVGNTSASSVPVITVATTVKAHSIVVLSVTPTSMPLISNPSNFIHDSTSSTALKEDISSPVSIDSANILIQSIDDFFALLGSKKQKRIP